MSCFACAALAGLDHARGVAALFQSDAFLENEGGVAPAVLQRSLHLARAGQRGGRRTQKAAEDVNKAKYGCDAIAHLLLLLTVDSMCRHS